MQSMLHEHQRTWTVQCPRNKEPFRDIGIHLIFLPVQPYIGIGFRRTTNRNH